MAQGAMDHRRIAIVGAGLAGLACAHGLTRHGATVALFDKGRGPGGRTSTRRIATPAGEAQFDHGAIGFEAHDPDFQAQVNHWAEQGVAAPWPAAGDGMWVGVPGMNALTRALSADLDVRHGQHVSGMARRGAHWHVQAGDDVYGPYDALVLAIPAEQAAPLLGLHDFDMARRALQASSTPCWTVMACFDRALPGPDVVAGRQHLARAVRNNAKPGRNGPEAWVIQASPAWSRAHLEDAPETVIEALLAALGEKLDGDMPAPVHATAHRWRFALPGSMMVGAMWNGAMALGACGDWLLGPTVEQAWLSGRQLARMMAGSKAEAELPARIRVREGNRGPRGNARPCHIKAQHLGALGQVGQLLGNGGQRGAA
jgi:predicted NAD/FAD-dependent oxidoreductase